MMSLKRSQKRLSVINHSPPSNFGQQNNKNHKKYVNLALMQHLRGVLAPVPCRKKHLPLRKLGMKNRESKKIENSAIKVNQSNFPVRRQ